MSLIKPDYENWKPKDPENQKLMRIAHGFEQDDRKFSTHGVDNLVIICV